MSSLKTIYACIAAISMFGGVAHAAPQLTNQTRQSTFRLGTQQQAASSRGGFTLCEEGDILVSENVDMINVIQGNSVSCFGGSGTPEHRYGRSHDLSLGDTAGLAWEIDCIHFALSQHTGNDFATVNVYIDLDGTPGPMPDGSDLWLIGSVDTPIPDTSVPVMITATPITPYPLIPDALIFIEIVIPETFPGTHFIGSNSGGEFSPSWLRTTNGECGIGSWVNPSALGYPDMHILEAIEISQATIADPCDDQLADCASDVDGDDVVSVADLLEIIGAWGICGDGTFRPIGDIAPQPNGDCCVDVADVLAVIANWGVECTPSGIDGLGINEIRTGHLLADDNEYIELIGEPGTDLTGYSYIVIGDGDETGNSGVLQTLIDLSGLFIAEDGLLSLGKAEMTIATPDAIIEGLDLDNSDNVTHLLVAGLNAVLDQDLDVDDDGVLDGMYWTELVDSVGLLEVGYEGEVVELLYADVILGPVGIYPPAHVFRCPDGGEWAIGVFANLAMDTPGEPNMCNVPDLDGDGIFDLVDNCYLYNPDQTDCNDNDIGDVCDLADGTSFDCNDNGIVDDCEEDCDGNGIPNDCEIADGALDCDSNGIPDSCDADCNENGVADACDIADGTSIDDNGNGVPDECEGAAFVINEINADPSNAPDGTYGDGDANGDGVGHFSDDEFVEIVNRSGAAKDMSNWTLSDGFGLRHTFPGGTIVSDGCAVVVFGGGNPIGDFGGAIVMVSSSGSLGLNNGGDTISIADESGQLQLYADYTLIGAGNNQSINLDPDVYGEDYSDHSTLAPDGSLFSPGTDVYGESFGDCGSGLPDSDGDGIPDDYDNCYLPNPDQNDCNGNDIGDVCDIADGTSTDDNANGIPDECEGTAEGAWINEFHYDNAGGDINEFIEIVILDSVDSNNVTLTLYNGNNSEPYASYSASEMVLGEVGAGFTLYSILHAGIQNGSPDGISLDISGAVAHFISYEGTITATGGPAVGLTSEDILLSENSGTTADSSLGLSGSGGSPAMFTWTEFIDQATMGDSNNGQVIIP